MRILNFVYTMIMHLVKWNLVIPSLWMILLPCGAYVKNSKFRMLNVTCNSFGVTINLGLQSGFDGAIYAEKHYFNPTCRYDHLPDFNNNISFFLPVNNCGTRVHEQDGKIYFSNTIIIQKYRFVETALDVLQNVTCKVELCEESNRENISTQNNVLSNIQQPGRIKSWMEFKVGPNISNSKIAKQLNVGDEFLLIVHHDDGLRKRDFRIRKCWAHDGNTMNNSFYSIEIFDFFKCEQSDFIQKFISATKILNVSHTVMYAKVKAFKLPSVVSLQFTCFLEVCVEVCFNFCDLREHSENNYFISNKLVKRSKRKIDDKPMNERIRLMKATIKALKDKLIKNNTLPGKERNDSILLKRVSSQVTVKDEVLETAGVTDVTVKQVLVTDGVTVEDEFLEMNGVTVKVKVLEADGRQNIVETPIINNSEIDYGFNNMSKPSVDTWNEGNGFNLTKSIVVLSPRESVSHHYHDISKSNSVYSCVSRIRFIAVTTILCFLLLCTILICIGLVLYLRKEKKKNLIDNFLLYNLY